MDPRSIQRQKEEKIGPQKKSMMEDVTGDVPQKIHDVQVKVSLFFHILYWDFLKQIYLNYFLFFRTKRYIRLEDSD